MFAYITRRVLYAIPILIGVNLLTFTLFFVVNSPDDMARLYGKRPLAYMEKPIAPRRLVRLVKEALQQG